MTDKYILDGHTPVPCDDLIKWARWFEVAKNLVVAQDDINDKVHVSTVFLGLDYAFGRGKRLLFETMVFVDGDGGEMRRYSTWDEAKTGHAEVVQQKFLECS